MEDLESLIRDAYRPWTPEWLVELHVSRFEKSLAALTTTNSKGEHARQVFDALVWTLRNGEPTRRMLAMAADFLDDHRREFAQTLGVPNVGRPAAWERKERAIEVFVMANNGDNEDDALRFTYDEYFYPDRTYEADSKIDGLARSGRDSRLRSKAEITMDTVIRPMLIEAGYLEKRKPGPSVEDSSTKKTSL